MASTDMDTPSADILQSLDANRVGELGVMWQVFTDTTTNIVSTQDFTPFINNFTASVNVLLEYGLGHLVQDFYLQVIEERLKEVYVSAFWKHFEDCLKFDFVDVNSEKKKLIDSWVEDVLFKSLEEICEAKYFQEKCLDILSGTLQSSLGSTYSHSVGCKTKDLHHWYQDTLSALLLNSLPWYFPDILHLFFKARLEEFTTAVEAESKDSNDGDYADIKDLQHLNCRTSGSSDRMDVDDVTNVIIVNEPFEMIDKAWIAKLGHVVHNLRELGFTAMSEDAYSTAIFSLLSAKVHSLAGEDHMESVLEPIRNWIQVVPLRFLHIILPHLSLSTQNNNDFHSSPLSSSPSPNLSAKENLSERLTRWHLRLEYFAYEALQDLRIDQLFDIIVDYPDSEDAIRDLKQCLDNTGQHAKLVDSFLSALRYRLLIAGASTNDILAQYISTIKALRILDPTGVFLEAVGQPIGEYLRGRKDASKCIVAMLTESSGSANGSVDANEGISLLEELSRDATNRENVDNNDYFNIEDEKAWSASQCWQPDPVEADPSTICKNRRSVDILGMLVGIFGSKEQLINEYCSMLAEKLYNKLDYNVEHETRTLELFKILFGEGSMQRCEIMINDLTASKRTNANIKTTVKQNDHRREHEENNIGLDILDATIISECFWPPFQEENIKVPCEIDQLLKDYSQQYHVLKAPRKIQWKKSLGMVKLELQFEDRSAEFVVSPVHATIIMHFQQQPRWTSKALAEVVGIPVDTLCRRITFWVNQGTIIESPGLTSDEHTYSIVENIGDANSDAETKIVGTTYLEEGEETSEEEQLQSKNIMVYEYFVKGMLTNFSTLKLEDIHKRLGDHSHGLYVYDLSLHQLQAFLSRLVSEDKLEVNDGEYRLRKQ